MPLLLFSASIFVHIFVMSQEPVLKDLKTQLADKHREAMRTAEKVKNAKRELDEKSGSVEPDTLLALLQVWPLFLFS